MAQDKSSVSLKKVIFPVIALLAVALTQVGSAYDPTPVLRNLYGAPHAVVGLYEVKPGSELAFVDTMVKAGPYSQQLSGFVNERLLEPLPAADGRVFFVCVSRYYDLGTANFVEEQRAVALEPLLVQEASYFELSLVEHLLADWGWEKGTQSKVMQARAFANDEIFQEYLSALSFFKAGYVGQVGMFETFPEGTEIEAIREAAEGRNGLSGASIFADEAGRYFLYSEYFQSPASAVSEELSPSKDGVTVSGRQAGVVIQNYLPR